MSDLRSKLIRLAHARPDLRPALLPLVVSTPPRVAKHQDHSLAASKLYNAIVGEVKRSKVIKEAIRDVAENIAAEHSAGDLVEWGEIVYPSVKGERIWAEIEHDDGWEGWFRLNRPSNLARDLKIGPSQAIPFIKFVSVDPKIKDLIVSYSKLKDRDIHELEYTLSEYFSMNTEDVDGDEFQEIYKTIVSDYYS